MKMKTLIFGWLKWCASMWASWRIHLLCTVHFTNDLFIYLFIYEEAANSEATYWNPFFFLSFFLPSVFPEVHLRKKKKKKKNQSGCQIKNACIKPYNRINKRSKILLTNSIKKTTTRYCNNYSKINEERKQWQTDLINAHIIQYCGGLSSNIF